jgi:hypothetical protein
MGQLPREAREGIMRAWLQILSKRNPDVTWVPQQEGTSARGAGGTTGAELNRLPESDKTTAGSKTLVVV